MDPKILREAALAYQAVYDEELRQEIEEQQDFENWVNSLVEEGYDLSEYTWEEMYEAYLSEAGMDVFNTPAMKAAAQKKQTAAASQFYTGNKPAKPDYLKSAQSAAQKQAAEKVFKLKPGSLNKPTTGATGATGGGKPPVAKPAASGGTVLAKKGGVEGKLDKSTGKFTTGAFSSAEKSRYASVAAKPAPTSTAAAKPATPSPTAAAKPALTTTSKPITSQPPESKSQASAGEIRGMIGRSMERQAASTPTAAPKPTPTPQKRPGGSVKPGSLVSGFDMFDVVKGYLIDEGFAETEQAAIAIMANMSEGWKLEIIDEAVKGEPSDRRRALAAERRKGIKPLPAKEGEKYAAHKISQMAYVKRARTGDDD